ncbi:MAG: SDR family oxidoreductase [Pseudomonadota bacterium]
MPKTALITGASSGIGAAIARIHAAKNGNLVLVARRRDRLEALKSELEEKHGVDVHITVEDLTEAEAPQRVYGEVLASGIEIDYLINNAGLGARGLFHEMAWEQSLSMIQLNAVALAGLTRAILPEMVARNAGRILNVTSTAAEMPGPLQAIYFATKGFAAYLSNALVEELRDTNVTVTNLMPMATATEFAEVAGMEGTKLFANTATARAVAKDGYAAMLRGDMDVYGGITTKRRVMQAILKAMPKRAALRAVRKAQEA